MILKKSVINHTNDLPSDFSVSELREIALPRSVLMCPADYFDVIDVKNPFMQGQLGKVNHAEAMRQWQDLKKSYEHFGIKVELIDPLVGCEDMVFCDNPVFVGIDNRGHRVCVPSRMEYPSRQREVAPLVSWFANKGYEVADLNGPYMKFEGGGDAIWHPGRGLIWGGYGKRSNPEVYPLLAKRFGDPVIVLELVDSRFYHLDTCFCPLDEKTVMLYPPAITEHGLDLIRRVFRNVIEVNESESVDLLACNAAAFLGKYVFIQRGAFKINQRLVEFGYQVIEVETSEFLKSGGSVFCMKMAIF